MKRHYTGTSSKNLDADAAGEQKTTSQPSAGGDPSRSNLLTAGYPVGESDRTRLGGFLKQCGYCRKQIPVNSDVFMYGYGFSPPSHPPCFVFVIIDQIWPLIFILFFSSVNYLIVAFWRVFFYIKFPD